MSYGVNQSLRLFNRTIKQVKAGERKIARADLAADDRPTDLFLLHNLCGHGKKAKHISMVELVKEYVAKIKNDHSLGR